MRCFRTLPAACVVAGALIFSAPAPVRASSASLPRTVVGNILSVGAMTPARTATGCAKTYEVKPNDSWNRIAKKVSVSMSLLLKVNKATTKTMLLIGDVICLPRAAVTESAARTGLVIGPPERLYSVKESAAIIREIFPDRLEERAIAIAKRESQLNAANINGSRCCLGLFQIHWSAHKSWLKNIGITTPEQMLDARWNAKAAFALYKRSNSWSAWE
jgi:LysM repeat protein